MYKGVLRDDERRKEKMLQRQAELAESRRKREIYERVQTVQKSEDGNLQ
jgi:protein PET117